MTLNARGSRVLFVRVKYSVVWLVKLPSRLVLMNNGRNGQLVAKATGLGGPVGPALARHSHCTCFALLSSRYRASHLRSLRLHRSGTAVAPQSHSFTRDFNAPLDSRIVALPRHNRSSPCRSTNTETLEHARRHPWSDTACGLDHGTWWHHVGHDLIGFVKCA